MAKTPKPTIKLRGQSSVVYDLAKVEACGALGMSIRETVKAIGMSLSALYQGPQERLEQFREAHDLGRSKRVGELGRVIMEAATQKMENSYKDPRLALEILRTMGDNWKQQHHKVEHTGSVELHHEAEDLPDAMMDRMCEAYLKTRGKQQN